jgi:LysR family transcriptional regulator, nitrogen assimilation regulatory protein
MNLRQLKYFVGIVDAGNMTRAAEELHVAQTALGMQIRQLEEDLGVGLLVRHSRGVEPTKAGRLLHARALAILKQVEETRSEVAACDREDSEAIRLGITPALMLILSTEITLNVRKHLPQVILTIVEGMSHILVDMLSRRKVDFILCYDEPNLPQFTRTALLQDDLVLATLPSESKGEPIAFVDVLNETLVLPERGNSVSAVVAHTARELGLELKTTYEVGSVSAMKDLCIRGDAVTIIPYFSIIEEVRSGVLDAQPIVMPTLKRTLFLASTKQSGPFRNEVGLTGVVRSSLNILLNALGPLAHPLWVRTA